MTDTFVYRAVSRLLAALGVPVHAAPMLTRWLLVGDLGRVSPRVMLHYFRRSELKIAPHNHPWDYWSLVLWPGYWERTDSSRTWYGPLSLLRRRADWKHDLEFTERGCWTLVWTGPKLLHRCPSCQEIIAIRP